MKILFLSQRVPYPPNRGDKITTWRLVERMSRDHDVEIVAFAHDEADVQAAAELERKGFPTTVIRLRPRWDRLRSLPLLLTRTPMTLGVYGSRQLQAVVDRKIGACDVAYAYSSSMGAFMLPHRDKARIMHFAELDSDKWRQYAERTGFPMSWIYRREWKTLWTFERELAHAVDENILCTGLEQKIFDDRIPGASSMVLRNGVDLSGFDATLHAPEPGHMVFVGVMDYYPNVEGCVWFVEEILPRIIERVPSAHLSIVGSHPTPEVEQLAKHPAVEVTGFVEDPRDWLRRAAVSVAPLRIARGIQNKVLEAMAMGLPVVGTTSATQGVEATPGEHFVLADEVEAQADGICHLLEHPERAHALGSAGRRFVEQNYDWEACLLPLDELLQRLGDGARRPTSASA